MSVETRVIDGEINRVRFKPKCSKCSERWSCILVLDGITGQCTKSTLPTDNNAKER